MARVRPGGGARRAAGAPARRALAALGPWLALALAACRACPPDWAGSPPERDGLLVAVGHAGPVFVEAEARRVALARAARGIADRIGIDVERRLSVTESDGKLFVEAIGRDGPTAALDGLRLLDEASCDDEAWVLVGLPVPR